MSATNPPSLLLRIVSLLASVIVWLLILIGLAWAFGALWFDFPQAEFRRGVAGGFALLALVVAVVVRPRWRAKLGLAVSVVLILVWWLTLQPRQFRDWKEEVALTAHAEIEGEVVILHNVRNFEYRSVTDFTPRYELRRVDLRKLRGVDVFINYWGSPYMAHPIFSFDFGDGGRVCFSIETRPEKGESYSALGGLYRQFELFYVVADERDVIRVRSNYRQGEDVYLYRLKAPHARAAFLEYVRTVNELHATPRWYNAVTNNCTTAIRHQRTSSERAPWDWRMLVNGFGDELLYERGGFDRALPFAELKRISRINERAKAANEAADFSEKIRAGLPGMHAAD
ncbi:MAG: DUF4105 domain-containing protein [Luteolibacter sp.]|jgi:hypothetical protein|nr:DUF4105 domain-containing protein [Luteolibacter sp.]